MNPIRNQELEDHVSAVESDLKINLIVPTELKNPHPIVKALSPLSFSGFGYSPQTDSTRQQSKTFDIAIGKQSLNRAKLILDTFIKAIETRGHFIKFEKEHTFIEIFDEKLRIRFWEKSKYKESSNKYETRDLELTGVLSIQYFRLLNYVEREWTDTNSIKLEEKLARVIGSLEYFAKKEKAERIEREGRWQEQKIRETIIQELNSRKESDFNKFKILLSYSQRWEKAQALRGYISHMEKFALSENLNEWISWATEKADWYDPAVAKNDTLLRPFCDFHDSLLNNSRSLDRYNIDKL